MTTASTSTDHAAPGVQLLRALRDRDLDSVRALLAPDIHLRGLLPGPSMEADDHASALAVFSAGYVNEAMEAIDVIGTHRVASRDYVAFRCRWRAPDGATKVFEQHAFYDTDDAGRITWMHLVCSGNHPAEDVNPITPC